MNAGSASGSAEYAHARLRARWGSRPDETAWHRIEITRDLAPVLELARSGSLGRWVQGLAPGAGLHEIEGRLRRRWREQVDEVAGWTGGEWQPAIRWCALLLDLPVLQQWARGEALPAWAAGDEVLGSLDDPARLLKALLEAARSAPDDLLVLWQQTWHRLLPAGSDSATIKRMLVPLLAAHAAGFATPTTPDGWAQRRGLTARLVSLMRRHPAEPIEAFVFLALQALELERLRAEIVGRAAFPKRTLHA
jgi:hypothetical protein